VVIRAVIFDIGGVLEYTSARAAWQENWAARLGLTGPQMTQRLTPLARAGNIGEISLAEFERRFAAEFGLDEPALAAFMAELWAEYLGTLNTELAAWFGALRPRYKTGILSNSFAGAREREQAAYGFEDLCDVIVYSHEEGLEKPDPRFYRIVTGRLGIEPEEAVFLDDWPVAVDGARAVGMRAVLFEHNEQAIADLEAWLRG
jgi:putative hydrolase of the HAD superfamily